MLRMAFQYFPATRILTRRSAKDRWLPGRPSAKTARRGAVCTRRPATRSKFARGGQDHPDAMIGMPTGPRSRESTFSTSILRTASMALLKSPNWQTLSSTIAQTLNGGRQLYFRSNGVVKNSAGKIAPGVDTRGDGGYVICRRAETGLAPGIGLRKAGRRSRGCLRSQQA